MTSGGTSASGPTDRYGSTASSASPSSSSTPATFPLAVKTAIELSFGPQTDPRTKELAAQRMSEIRFSVLNGDFLACDAYDESNVLGRAKAPTLIICGAEDKMTPLRYSQAMRERIKKSLLHVVDGAGHNVMLEQPLIVANVLNLFLDSISYRPGEAA